MLAGGSALLLAVAMSGAAFGASPQTLGGPALEGNDPEPGLLDTTATFEDLDGNGVDDDCQEAVIADPEAAALAEAAADLDGDGTISVSEAAQSGRTGGEQCNHGGYVSAVARADCLAADTEEPEPTDAGVTGPVLEAAAVTVLAEEVPDADACDDDDEDEAEEDAEDADDADSTCEAVAAPVFDPATLGTPGALGAWISLVARSEAVGGPNCNHGGAVSEAAKAAKVLRDVAKAERAAERAAAKAERDAAKAERAAERAAARAERDAAKAGGQGKHGKPDKANGKGH